MTREQIVLTAITVVLIPLIVAEVRYRNRLAARMLKAEALLDFLQKYLLKNAVLEFHNNPNPETDKIIEKINDGDELTAEEMGKLKSKLEGIVGHAPNKKKELKARNTLDLLRMYEDFHESIQKRGRARNRLFTE